MGHKNTDIKAQLYEQLAQVGKAVGSPHRLEVIELLAQGERTVEGLASALSIPVANMSHHLASMRAARLVDARKEGTFVFYRLSDPDVFELARMIRTLAERHIAEVDRLVRTYFRAPDELEPIGREELLERVRAGEVVVLDVRPTNEYESGHIAGALSVPLDELERRLAEIPQGKELVAYCRGPYCVMALKAVKKLREQGRVARRLLGGFPEWRHARLPTEVSGKRR